MSEDILFWTLIIVTNGLVWSRSMAKADKGLLDCYREQSKADLETIRQLHQRIWPD